MREAEADIADACQWYEQRLEGLCAQFLLCLEACLERLKRNPLAHPVLYKDVRRAFLRRFPFSVFYVAERKRVIVLAVFHASRDPQAWPGREQPG